MSNQVGWKSDQQATVGSANKDPSDKGGQTEASSFVPPTIRELGVLENFTVGSGSGSGSGSPATGSS